MTIMSKSPFTKNTFSGHSKVATALGRTLKIEPLESRDLLTTVSLHWTAADDSPKFYATSASVASIESTIQSRYSAVVDAAIAFAAKQASLAAEETTETTANVTASSSGSDLTDRLYAACATADVFVNSHYTEMRVSDPLTELTPQQVHIDLLGMTLVSYCQTYHGVAVFGSEVLVHIGTDGEVTYASGRLVSDIAAGTNVSVTSEMAVTISESLFRQDYGTADDSVLMLRSARLCIFNQGLLDNTEVDTSYLAWEVELVDSSTVDWASYYIDATSGTFITQLCETRYLRRAIYDCSYAAITGTDSCPYGQKEIDGYKFGRLEGSDPIGPNPYQEYTTDTDDTYDVLGDCHNVLWTMFGRDGGNAHGGTDGMYSSYYYRTDFYTYYEGRDADFCSTYGSAYSVDVSRMCHQYTSVDIIAHEYAHSITTFLRFDYSGAPMKLTYSGESGALNESFSDCFAEYIENYHTGSNDWLNGTGSLGGIVRNLADPTQLSQRFDSSFPDPDRYLSEYFYAGSSDDWGVHYNSTVISKAFYLVCMGGSFNGHDITALGLEKGLRIWYRAYNEYFTATETFNEAYYDFIQAATDLYGDEDVAQVRNALQAIEIDKMRAAEITVTGLGQDIADDDITPRADDGTNFGETLKGSAALPHTFTVTNSGNIYDLTLTISSIPAGYTVTEPLDSTLSPGESDTFTVQLSTDAIGTFSGEIVLTSNDADEGTFNFSISGIVAASSPEITILDGTTAIASGDTVDFGTATHTDTGISKTFTIRNDGEDTLVLDVPSFADTIYFTVGQSERSSLVVGETTTFTVTLNTGTVWSGHEEISLVSNDGDESAFSILLSGVVVAIPAEITVLDEDAIVTSGDAINFGSVMQNKTGPSKTFTIRNDGEDTLVLDLSSFTSTPYFTVVQAGNSSLAAGETTTFTVTLNTGTAWSGSEQILLASNDGNFSGGIESPFVINVSGCVLSTFTILDGTTVLARGDTVDFGSTIHNGTANTKTFAIRNDGEQALVLDLSSFVDTAHFKVGQPEKSRLEVGETTTFTVSLNTAAVWSGSEQITLSSNDANQPAFAFLLSGVIATVPAEITVLYGDTSLTIGDTVDFGSVVQNRTGSSKTFTIRNDGEETLTLDSSSFKSTTYFTVERPEKSDLAAGETTTFAVTSVTGMVWSGSEVISFTSNDDDETPFTLVAAGIVTIAPAISVSLPDSLSTTEAGGAVQVTVVLTTQPTAKVTISVTSSDTTEGVVSVSSLTFTPENWNVAHAITVTGVDDAIADSNVAYVLTLESAVSEDADYTGMDVEDVSLTNTSDDASPAKVSTVSFSSASSVTTISVVFTTPMDIEQMIANGSIASAVSLVTLSGRSVDLSSGTFTYDSATMTLQWTDSGVLADNYYELVLDGSLLTDTSGNLLCSGTSGLTFSIGTYSAAQAIQADGTDIQVLWYSVPTTADWNSDGLMDLIVGEEVYSGAGKVRVYINSGTNAAPVYTSYFFVQSNGADLTVPASGCRACLGAYPRIYDWNNDGMKDLLIGMADGRILVYLNLNTDADPQFGECTAVQVGATGSKSDLDVGDRATFETIDWNSDGLDDLVVGALNGQVYVYLNSGSAGSPDFQAVTMAVTSTGNLLVSTGRSSVAVADLNGDGRKDLILGDTDGQLLYYENIRTDASPVFADAVALEADGSAVNLTGNARSRPYVVDYNSDGILDILVGSYDGLVRVYFGLTASTVVNGDNDNDGTVGGEYVYTFLADAKAPASNVAALTTTQESLSFTVSWSGSDGTNGSGVANYDIYVSDNGGDYTLWLDDTTATSAVFTGQSGRVYRFYSVASDNVGNVENAPTTADATTSIVAGSGMTLISSEATDCAIGQSVTFTVTITSASGAMPTGTVIFKDGSKTLNTATLNSNGTASFTTSFSKVGGHKITAIYAGDANTPAGQCALTQNVCGIATKTVLTAATSGSSVTLTATLTDAPSGAVVVFMAGTKSLGKATINSSGRATLAVAASNVPGQTITATYKGNKQYLGSSATLTMGSNLVATTVTLAASHAISYIGQSITFTVTASATDSTTPDGTITFKDGSTILGTATLATDGTATFTTSSLTVGSHAITASYAGNTTYDASAATVGETVSLATTSIAWIASAAPSVVGQSVTFTIIVSADSDSSPSGTVTIKDGSTTLGIVTLDSDGTGKLTTSFTKLGNHKIKAIYAGTTIFTASSALLLETVKRASTTVSIGSSDDTADYGRSVTYTVTVAAASPSGGTPTGKVVLMDGSTKLNTAKLSANGTATFTISTLIVGSHTLTASYVGTKSYAANTGSFVETVGQSTTTATVATSSVSSAYGKSVTLTATVSAILSGAVKPTGSVTFYDGSTSLGTVTLNAKGIASLKTSSLTVGSHKITAIYSGSTNLTGSTSNTLAQTITAKYETLLASGIATSTVTVLNLSQLNTIIEEAEKRLTVATGVNVTAALTALSFQIVNLSGGFLDEATADTIFIDDDAAGYGWFVDDTPADDDEFSVVAGSNSSTASSGTSTAVKVDLLTVVMHEMGHTLGYDDTTTESIMNVTLSLGVRRTAAVDRVFATLS